MDEIIESLFCETHVVSTRAVARAFDLSETDARLWAEELEVARIGSSYAWARADAEELAEELEELESDSEAAEGEDTDNDDEPESGEDDDEPQDE